ncbi:bifunctional diaminohydroxyphosphoribosylaminopyrimidine deaminase/5-amino-6-(5-phosphoribosylamino)uracil reductase RibD [Dyella jejuensis]|uniref:Riboflavin biosynthesis protein RibD n=2 Tax=Dyella jejuensis TaxID=1432009 RepID=A0ABW8JJV4_9GAMM
MAQALRLAERGLYTTQPNPRVGCVVTHGEQVVGQGWHERAGGPHAEVHALREAGARARDATAYVTLEPCAHHGRTPPCADALVAAGVARVVIAVNDPFPQVAGRGIGQLRAAGIAVECGLMQEAARELNIGFFSRIERQRPWVRVKLAMSLDGRTALANGESKWITGAAARMDVQHWRARSSAILTGIGTVLADDPWLTVRLDDTPFTPPMRVILDRHLRTPAGSHVLDGQVPTLLLHGAAAPMADGRFERVEPIAIAEHDGRLDMQAVLALLAERGCSELHVEAGPTLCGALFAAGLADELLLYVAPVMLGDSARPLMHLPPLAEMAARWRLRTIDQRQVGEDWRLRLRPQR